MRRITFTLALVFLISSISFAQHREETVFGSSGIDFTGFWGGSTNGLVEFNNNFSLIESSSDFIQFFEFVIVDAKDHLIQHKHLHIPLIIGRTNYIIMQ